MTTVVGSQSCIVVDVSQTGAKVRGIDLPAEHEEVVVNFEGIVGFGEIAWCDGPERGIQFESPLSCEDETRLQAKVREARGLPPEVKAAFDDWSLGLAR